MVQLRRIAVIAGLKLYVGVKETRGEYRECDNLNTMTIGRTRRVVDKPTSQDVLGMVRQSDSVWVHKTDGDRRKFVVEAIEEYGLVLVPGCEGPRSRTRLILSTQSETSSCQRIVLREVTKAIANIRPQLTEVEIKDVGSDHFSSTDGSIYRFTDIARLLKSDKHLDWEWEAGAPIFI
jgi:hypothetical protein